VYVNFWPTGIVIQWIISGIICLQTIVGKSTCVMHKVDVLTNLQTNYSLLTRHLWSGWKTSFNDSNLSVCKLLTSTVHRVIKHFNNVYILFYPLYMHILYSSHGSSYITTAVHIYSVHILAMLSIHTIMYIFFYNPDSDIACSDISLFLSLYFLDYVCIVLYC
jgi:hypothetical protein